MFNHNKPAEAIKGYAGKLYIQHNPAVSDGKEAFIEYFDRMAACILQAGDSRRKLRRLALLSSGPATVVIGQAYVAVS